MAPDDVDHFWDEYYEALDRQATHDSGWISCARYEKLKAAGWWSKYSTYDATSMSRDPQDGHIVLMGSTLIHHLPNSDQSLTYDTGSEFERWLDKMGPKRWWPSSVWRRCLSVSPLRRLSGRH